MEKKYSTSATDCFSHETISTLFRFLHPEEIESINSNKIFIHYHPGETIQKQGTFMSHVILVNSGLVKVYLEGANLGEAILRIVKPGNCIGGPGIFHDQLHHFSVSAMVESSICFVEMEIFKRILDQNSKFAAEFLKDFSRNVISVYNRLISLTQKQIPGRMADALIYLYEEVSGSNPKLVNVSRHDLADLSAISRESSTKVLRQFQKDGLLRINGQELEILELEELRMISRHG